MIDVPNRDRSTRAQFAHRTRHALLRKCSPPLWCCLARA